MLKTEKSHICFTFSYVRLHAIKRNKMKTENQMKHYQRKVLVWKIDVFKTDKNKKEICLKSDFTVKKNTAEKKTDGSSRNLSTVLLDCFEFNAYVFAPVTSKLDFFSLLQLSLAMVCFSVAQWALFSLTIEAKKKISKLVYALQLRDVYLLHLAVISIRLWLVNEFFTTLTDFFDMLLFSAQMHCICSLFCISRKKNCFN